LPRRPTPLAQGARKAAKHLGFGEMGVVAEEAKAAGNDHDPNQSGSLNLYNNFNYV
jgi:hypothetical protein